MLSINWMCRSQVNFIWIYSIKFIFFYLEKTLMEHLQLKWGRYAHLGRVPEFNILVSIFKHLLVVEK